MAYTYLLAGVLLQGPLTDRPAASAGRYWYLADDENDGTLYHSDGVATWTQMAAGVSAGGGGVTSVTDGVTTVSPATSLFFSVGATVADDGGGVAEVAITAAGGTVTSVGSSDSSITVANPTTTPDLVIAVVDGGSP